MAASRGPQSFVETLAARPEDKASDFRLQDGSHVGVIGGGPAGSFASYFLLDMARRMGTDVRVDIYEPKDFSSTGPTGCNHCGGIVSESLVQILAADGINIPPTVVQRGIDSYVLHMDVGSVRIETPHHEKRIAAVFRGAGPRGTAKDLTFSRSFDDFLLKLAVEKGAGVVRERVERLEWEDGFPRVTTHGGVRRTYDLAVVAVGVNTPFLRTVERLGFGFRPPETTRTYIAELPLGREMVQQYLGTSMHVFLMDLPRLEFAALIPKGDFVTMVVLGEEIDTELVQALLDGAEVKRCLPPGWSMPPNVCHCLPMINVREAVQPFADRLVLIGDCGVARLYKDGIGSAYRAAKAVATTAIMEGVSAGDFRKHYLPTYRAIAADNTFGKVIFLITGQIQKRRYARRAVLTMVIAEQQAANVERRMSSVLWDTFTGSAPYRDAFMRTLHPAFLGRLLWNVGAAIWNFTREKLQGAKP